MKKLNILCLFCLLLISFVACKKDSDGSPKYYIRAMIGDSEKVYTSTPVALKGVVYNNNYGLMLSAYLSSTFKTGLEIQIGANGPISTGTYIQSGSFNSTYSITAEYRTGTPDLSGTFAALYNKISATEPLQITITGISDMEVAGTFSGMFYSQDFPSDSLRISNGSFNLPIQ